MPTRPVLPLLVCAGLLMPAHTRGQGAGAPAGLGEPAQKLVMKKGITALRYSPDGRWLAAGLDDGTVSLRDADTLRERRILDTPGKNVEVGDLAFSPDAKTLAVLHLRGNVRLFDVRTGKALGEVKYDKTWAASVAFSSDGKTVAVGGVHGIEILTYGKELQSERRYDPHPGTTSWLVFSADGKTLRSADDVSVRSSDPATGEMSKTKFVGGTVTGLVRAKDRFLCILRRSTLHDVDSGRELSFSDGHPSVVEAVEATPDGRLALITGSHGDPWRTTGGGFFRVLDLKTGLLRQNVTFHRAAKRALAVRPDGKRFALGGDDGTLQTWDLPERWTKPLLFPNYTLRGHKATVHAVAFGPKGKALASGDGDGTVQLWEVGKKEPAATFATGRRGVRALAFSPDGKALAVAGLDGTVRLHDLATRKLRTTLRHPTTPVLTLAFHPAGRLLAAGTSDGRVTLWDLAREKEQYALDAHRGPTRALAFSPDGKTLLSSGSDGRVHLWDVASEKALHTFSQKGSALALALSADGKLLASAGSKGVLHLWDLPRRRVLATRSGLGKFVIALGFNPETGKGGGRLLASASLEKGVLLWRVDPTGKTDMVGEVPGNKGPARCLTFSPDGRWLATGGTDRAVRLWALGPAEW
jgi:WD40 repeat protein